MSKILPAEELFVEGLIVWHVFFTLPAIPLISLLQKNKKPDLPWILAFVSVTAFTWWFHYDYAGYGTVLAPLLATGLAYLICSFGRILPRLRLEQRRAKKRRKWESRKMESSAYQEGWLAFQNDLDVIENPYGDNDFKCNDWIEGWGDACERNSWF